MLCQILSIELYRINSTHLQNHNVSVCSRALATEVSLDMHNTDEIFHMIVNIVFNVSKLQDN